LIENLVFSLRNADRIYEVWNYKLKEKLNSHTFLRSGILFSIKENTCIRNAWFITLGSIGGFLLSLTGLSIGWLLGTLIVTGLLSFLRPKWALIEGTKGIQSFWRHIGQWILGIELGQQVNLTVLDTFENNYVLITIMLFLSIAFALLAGFILWRFTNISLLTSLFATTPGGISAMPSIAEEVGANTIVVSIVQLMRIFMVVGTVPLFAVYWYVGTSAIHNSVSFSSHGIGVNHAGDNVHGLIWTSVLALSAWGGYFLGKQIKLPAPWLVGGMLGVGIVQTLESLVKGLNLVPFWPHWIIVIAQVLIGASIGSRINKTMFKGARQIVIVGFLSSLGLIFMMIFCSIGVSEIANIPLVTSVLAFAPGGVAEMATASLSFHVDSAFVVAVQTLRLVTIFILLPPMFRLFNRHILKKSTVS
jgi:membrane AbrB-like protein